jgi:hypothetical protein
VFGLIVVLLFEFWPADALSNTIPPSPNIARSTNTKTIFFLM